MPGAPSGLVTIGRVSQGKPWAGLSSAGPLGQRPASTYRYFPPKTPDQIRNTLLRGNKTSKIHLNLAPFRPDPLLPLLPSVQILFPSFCGLLSNPLGEFRLCSRRKEYPA